MLNIPEAAQPLKDAGFQFPHELGLFSHPFLDDAGDTIDPVTLGFEPVHTGGGCMAHELVVGDYVLCLTSEDGCSLPEEPYWYENLIGVLRAGDREEIAVLTGLEWLEVVAAMTRGVVTDQAVDRMSATELSAWYVEQVGYDPLTDDPSLTLEAFRDQVKEHALIERCNGLDGDAYQLIEAQRKA